MDINKESIFDIRPWKIYGEGPVAEAVNPINGPGFNEEKINFRQKIFATIKKKKFYIHCVGYTHGKCIANLAGQNKRQWRSKAN